MTMTVTNSVDIFARKAFGCLTGWASFNTSCYHVSREPISWMDSMKMCQMHGAYLVQVDSASEDTFINSLMKTHGVSDAWLGGSDWSLEGRWVWEPDGNVFQYSNFLPGQPNNHNGENCLLKEDRHQYYWNDKDCDIHRAYICEDPCCCTDLFGRMDKAWFCMLSYDGGKRVVV